MFRILVISLFVANLLLFAFQRTNPAVQPETTVTPAVKKNSNIPTIHLYGEMVQDQGLFTGNRQCFSLGPFHSSEDKDEFRLLLQEVSTRINERQTEALVEKGYWVFIAPYDSLLEANQELISLQALGLEDISVVFDGKWKNAISMGYFMRRENAQQHKESVESRGYETLMRVQREGESRYWLDYEQNPGSSLIALDMQNRPNDFMQRSLPCPEEDTVEFAGEDSQQPAQVMAEVQVPVEEIEPALVRNEDPVTGGDVESAPQERLEALPVQAVETETEDVASGSGDAIGTVPEDAVGTGQEDNIETEAEDAVGTGQEDNIESIPEDAAVTGQEDNIETVPEDAVGTGQDDNIESIPEDAAVTGLEDTIETGAEDAAVTGLEDTIETASEDAAVTGQEDNIETVPEDAVGTGQEDNIGTASEDAAVTGQEDNIETVPEDAVGTGQEDNIESIPEDAAVTGLEDTIETASEDAAMTGQDDNIETGAEDAAVSAQEDAIETGAADAVETVQEVAVDTSPENSVGTGPLDVIDTEQGSAADTGPEDTLETGQEPDEETVPDDSGEIGTGEG